MLRGGLSSRYSDRIGVEIAISFLLAGQQNLPERSTKMKQVRLRWSEFAAPLIVAALVFHGAVLGQEVAPWEVSNPLLPIPDPPLGIGTEANGPSKLTELPDPPTPERVRLGRWLFFDKRLSADNTISCATCHRPEEWLLRTHTRVDRHRRAERGSQGPLVHEPGLGAVSHTSSGMGAPLRWKSRPEGP